ncbi:5'-nucleotidase C-terminal domain-containing protein [Tritonibacter multivorans]|nr:5'-nucleotidase C-terminal domain-containing protein [Tritonibacter multivorans]MDA7419793.1 5'-nucleotidase C-terminal domain-containing protein [Tritonibacter multivorans]
MTQPQAKSVETRSAADAAAGRLRVLATSDVHVHLQSFDYYSDNHNPTIGLTRTAKLIADARAEMDRDAAPGATLLVDNGDWMQGTPMGEVAVQGGSVVLRAGRVHPAVRAFDYLAYDAVGLGNHEFNFGLDVLRDVLTTAPCPVLCANIQLTQDTAPLPIAPHVVLERQISDNADLPPLRIGVFSVLPPQTATWDSAHLSGRATFLDMVEVARASIAALRDQGCDAVVALAHTGLGAEHAEPMMENALRPIAALPGLDAVVGGHTHLLLPDPEGKAPALPAPTVMPGTAGSHLGVIDLSFAFDGTRWQRQAAQTELRAICPAGLPPVDTDLGLETLLEEDHQLTRAAMAEPVGQASQNLHSYFTFLAPDRALALAAEAQAAAVRQALAGTGWADLPLLSAMSPAKFGGRAGPRCFTDVPAGPLSLRHVADLYMYPNELRCLVVDGATLRDWLEMAAGYFRHATAGRTGQNSAPLLGDPLRAGHNFDSIFGIQYQIDPTAPARFGADGTLVASEAHRIRDLRYQGQPVSDDMRFAVAVNSYRADGGGNFLMLKSATPVELPPISVRDALQSYIQGQLPQDPLADLPYPWRFAKDLGVSALALTGPGARAHLDDLPAGVRLQEDLTPRGFLALELDL